MVAFMPWLLIDCGQFDVMFRDSKGAACVLLYVSDCSLLLHKHIVNIFQIVKTKPASSRGTSYRTRKSALAQSSKNMRRSSLMLAQSSRSVRFAHAASPIRGKLLKRKGTLSRTYTAIEYDLKSVLENVISIKVIYLRMQSLIATRC